jgi:large subunit ribosomal protein L25
MSKRPAIEAVAREIKGRKVKALRRQGLIPANIFGKKTDSVAIHVKAADFIRLFSEVGETTLVDIKIEAENSPRPVLIVNVQHHPVTSAPIHIDFHQVSLKEKVTANIPVEIIGESPAVKDLGGVLLTALNEIEVEALPTDLPEKIEVDISHLSAIGDSIAVKDIKVDSNKITVVTGADETVVNIQEPAAEEETADQEEPKETETTVQGKTEADEAEGEANKT